MKYKSGFCPPILVSTVFGQEIKLYDSLIFRFQPCLLTVIIILLRIPQREKLIPCGPLASTCAV